MKQHISDGARIGLAGAGSVVLAEHILARMRLNTSPLSRTLARLTLAGGAAWAADRLDAPRLATGIVAGAVLVTALDVGVAMIASTPERIDPPPVDDPARLGDPWPPRPPYGPS